MGDRTEGAQHGRSHSRGLAALLALLALVGCFQVFKPIRAVTGPDGMVFELPSVEAGLELGTAFRLLDLSVTRRDCDSGCDVWLVVAADAAGVPLGGARIGYGETLPGTVTRTGPQSLVPGRYMVGATVQELDSNGGLARSLSLEGGFSVND